MNVLSWNCRWSEGRATLHTMYCYLHATREHIAFISETKCSTDKVVDRVSRLPLKNFEIIPSASKGGGLWLLWSDDVKINILERSFYFFFVRVENASGSFILGFIYGDPHHHVTEYIYDRILFYLCSSLPLCLIGDFNYVLMTNEKFGGS